MWEYHVIDTTKSGVPLTGEGGFDDRLRNGLDRLGKEGWELCGILSTLMVFKRMKRAVE